MVSFNPDQRRRALRAFMDHHKLRLLPWAKAARLSESGVRNFLAGRNRTLTDETYEKLADAANELLNADWVSAAVLRGEKPQSTSVAIAGKVGAGQQIVPFDDSLKGAGIGEVERPPGAAGDIVAAEVEGDSMLPVYRAGDIIFYHRDGLGAWTDHVGDECVVALRDGRVFVKVLARGSTPKLATLNSYNASPIADVRVEWASPIRWVKRAGRFAGGRLPLVTPTR